MRALEEHVDDDGRERLAAARRSLAEATTALRDLALRLRPSGLEEHGLASAIERQADRLRVDPGIAVDVSVEDMPELGEEAEITVFRVVQEALTNVQRHARANHASVLVRKLPGRVRVIIEDDGVGFDPDADTDRLGLAGLRERVALLDGTATLESHPGAGTTVVVEIPA
jgi:signal transduction histidine kinase